MSGRGGKGTSLTQEQMQKLGLLGKDMTQVQNAPPPIFPSLMSKPVTVETTATHNYQLLWKEQFLSHMRDSPYFLRPKVAKKNNMPQRYSDLWSVALENSKAKDKGEFIWTRMPSELQPRRRKRRAARSSKSAEQAKKAKQSSIESRLQVLEEKERAVDSRPAQSNRESESEQEADEEEVVPDEEMDDENDYGNSYFDNGESYNDEDDNLDDGPVY